MAKSTIDSFLDEDINTFLEEGDIPKSKVGVGGYLDASYQSAKRALTPEKKDSHQDLTDKTLKEIFLERSRRTGEASPMASSQGLQQVLGMGEAALTFGTGAYDFIRAPVAAMLRRAAGLTDNVEAEANRQIGQQTWEPRSEYGKKYVERFGPLFNDLLLPAGMAHVGMPKGSMNLARLQTIEKQKGFLPESKVRANLDSALPKPVETNPAVEAFLTGGEGAFDNIRKSQGAPKNLPVTPNPVIDSMVSTINKGAFDPEVQAAKARQEAAQQAIDARQAALEFEVKKQATQDFNAAERVRQEQAPTGYKEWVEQQRQAAEQRQPGNNTPLDFTKEEVPYGLKEEPFQPDNTIPYDQSMLDKSLPVEVADTLNNTPSPDPFNRYSPNQAARRILIEGEQPPINKTFDPRINKFGQGGAVDPKLVEDLYKFGKSIVRGPDGNLVPVYHGTTKVKEGFNPIRGLQSTSRYEGDLGSWFSSTPEGTDTFAGARTGVPEGNVHQVYLNITNPKVFNTHAEFKQWFNEQGGSTNKTRRQLIKEGYDGIEIKNSATDGGGARTDYVAFNPEQIESAISPGTYKNKYVGGNINRSQRGAIDPDLMTLGIPKLISGVKRLVQKTPQVDSMATPINPETISAKAEKRAKANAAKVDVYQSITTKQEALDPANLGKDLPPYVTQEATAGVGGVVRNHPNNGPLKYARWALNDYTGSRDAFLKKYVTGKDAYNDTYKKLNPQEQADVYEMRKWMSDNQVDYSPELGQKAGLSEAAMKHMEARQKALDAAEAEWGAMNQEKGLETFPHRMGYMASIFDRNYQALVGTMKDGVFKMDGFIGAKSLKEFRDALKHYEGKHIIKLGDNGRTGLRTQGQSKFRAMDDMAFLLNAMAEHDPKYADMKGALATAKAISNKGYMNFDVHEMRKAGVTGHQGNKPWVDKATNIKEALEAEITYLDQAANYIYGQKFLDRMADLQTDLRAVRPNTAKYLDKYVNHITGKSLEPTAAAVNQIVDVASKLTGKTGAAVGVKVPENPAGLLRSTGTVMNAMLMNIVNAGMFTAQTLQLPIAGLTESARIRAQYGMNPTDIATSMGRSFYMRGMLALLDHYGKLDQSNIPSHMKDAWHYLKEHGMDDFNEVMLSHDVLQSDAMTKTKQVAFWPTVVPEKITRPAMFLWMTDMFHRAGFDNKEALLRAKYATDFSMTDYRYEEAPLVYDRMGVLNPETSALQRYKHNAINQVISRTKESKEFPAAFLMATGLAVGFGGLLGLPAMNELDQMVIQPLTGKSAREHLEAALGSDNRLADGLASAYSHLDLGSRFSLADVAPNSFGEAVAGARLSKLYKMGVAAYEAGKNQDEASLRALGQEFVPSGLGQAYKEAMYTNDEKQLLNKKGQRMFDTPREGGLSMAAIMGARPLEEKRISELDYARNKRLTDIQKKQADASKRMEMAINFRNEADFQKHLQTYKENFGDLKQIKPIIERAVKQGMMTETQRMQGVPGKTPLSIKRFLEFQE